MKQGDKITIYEDPFTMSKPLGEAELIQFQPRQDGGANGATWWSGNVRFLDDGRETYAQWVTLDSGEMAQHYYKERRAEMLKEMESTP